MKSRKGLIFGVIAATLILFPNLLLAEAGWDNGFYIKSEDGDFKMKIGGRIQFQEVIQKRTGAARAGSGRVTTPSNDFSDTFKIRRARIKTTGKLFDKVNWFTIINTGTASLGSSPKTSWYAGFTYKVMPQFSVSGGNVQLPMDRMGENSSSWYLGVEPPLTATQEDGVKGQLLANDNLVNTIARDSMSMPFDLGLRIDGDIGEIFSYAAAVGNGNGYKNVNANNELSFGFRAAFNVIGKVPYKETDYAWSETPKVMIGFGTGFEDEDAADENIAGIIRQWSWISSGDVAFRYQGFSLNSEFYYRIVKLSATTVEDTNGNRKLNDVGYYVNAGYFVIPKKLEFMLTGSQLFREGPDNDSNEFGGGLNWYIYGNRIKFQFDYTNILDYDDVPGLNNATYHKFRLMYSMFI